VTSPVRLIFVSNELRWSAFSLFNANTFPSSLATLVDTCGVKFALIDFHTKLTRRQEDEDVQKFLDALSSQGSGLIDGVKHRSDLTHVAYYHSIELISSFSNTLYAMKAFLDVFAQLLVRLIEPEQRNMTFKRATIEGHKCSGGRLINWLNGRNATEHPYARPIAECVLENSSRWITESVHYRDQLSHYTLAGLVEMQTPLQTTDPVYSQNSINRPTLPNGLSVGNYCEACEENTRMFASRTLDLIPKLPG
jgi:hypothetical protein